MKLWAMREAGHHSGVRLRPRPARRGLRGLRVSSLGTVRKSGANALATLILGGGVPKNYNLQPEPALGQILGLPNVRGYKFDVQIVTAPVTDGSLSSCPPAEAVTWGKVDKDTYLQVDGEHAGGLFDGDAVPGERAARQSEALRTTAPNQMSGDELAAKHPSAAGYLRAREGYRLFGMREELCGRLTEDVRANREWLLDSLRVSAGRANPPRKDR